MITHTTRGGKYFVHTFGCQMNVNDSLRMGEALATIGYRPTPTADQADLIILNTCAIREKAEDKMLSALGRYRAVKTQRGALLAVGGCVAQQEKSKLLARVPYLDFVFGPDAIGKLPEMVTRVIADRVRVAETAWVDSEEYVFPRADPGSSAGKVTEFVTVMKGCDNVCSFCVVPHTRGREVSRPFVEVLEEIASLTEVGVREVTLIGQNVNSYRGGISFAELLLRVAQVPGIERVRFTTSHPHDLSDALIDAFRDRAAHRAALPPAGAERERRRAPAHEARLHRGRVPRPARRTARGAPRHRRHHRHHRRLPRRDRGRLRGHPRAHRAGPLREPVLLRLLRPAAHRGQPQGGGVGPGPARGEGRAARAAPGACSDASAARSPHALVGQEVEVLVEGPSRSDPDAALRPDAGEPHGELRRDRARRRPGPGPHHHGSPSALLGVEVGIVDLPPVPPLRPRTEAA